VHSCLSHVRYFELMVVVKRRMEGGKKIMYHYKEHWNVCTKFMVDQHVVMVNSQA